ncbi:MAG: DUF2809 domain-containing protein, partial [Oscillospiraceae bacterium]|nr:DUF2809 domain-containing protein [Oscillospiraceae bacterium]
LRLLFAVSAVILLVIEIIIGLYVHDAFVRPYLGDTLVVILIWCVLRIIFPTGKPWLSAAVFLFAVGVEITQIFPLCDLLGIRNGLIRTLMGTSFAWWDIVAYLAGCLVTAAGDLILTKRKIGA